MLQKMQEEEGKLKIITECKVFGREPTNHVPEIYWSTVRVWSTRRGDLKDLNTVEIIAGTKRQRRCSDLTDSFSVIVKFYHR
jgi:hypothetical protein